MDSKKKFLIGVGVLFGGLLAATTSSVQAFGWPGSSDSEPKSPPTVADCVTRTGKTEAECQAMMDRFKNGERPKMTVAGCVERTGKTEAECQTIIDNRKSGEHPPMDGGRGDRAGMHGDGTGMMGGDSGRSIGMIEALSARAERQKADRAQMFVSITTRTEKFIDYLDSKSVDTSSVKAMLEVLKTKMTAALTAFDAYIASLKIWESDRSDENTQAIATNKAALKTSLSEVKTYYHETLIPALHTLVESVNE